MSTQCPGDRTLAALAEADALSPVTREAILQHMAECESCRETITALTDVLPRTRVGALARYRIDGLLGAGGFGIVLSGYDLELDRSVAIKITQTERGSPDDRARTRFVREARALAKVTHPNVVTIYDAGILDDDETSWDGDELFIVMELVAGGTLRDWLAQEPRSWQQIVEMFIGAARGLAAAHALGLVHRDFKPTNVLVGSDQRPRVSDFGLVRFADHPIEQARARPPVAALGSPITATGSVVGTPRYMAPEQLEGGSVDPRADQYAFCRSLQEALAPPEPSRAAGVIGRVPPRLREVIERGVQVRPDDRYADMNELTDALQRAVARTPRTLIAVGASLALIGATAGAVLTSQSSSPAIDSCAPPPTAIWSPARWAATFAQISSVDPIRAITVIDRLDHVLTRYAADWEDQWGSLCRVDLATTGSFAPGSPHRDCLDERQAEAEALVAALQDTPDPSTMAAVVSATYELAPNRDCAGSVAPRINSTGPRINDLAAMSLRDRLHRARAISRTEHADSGPALALQLADEANHHDFPAIRAEALLLAALLHEQRGAAAEAEQVLRAAIDAATRAGNDHLVATALIDLIYVHGEMQARFDEATTTARAAEALLKRLSGVSQLWVSYYGHLGGLQLVTGEYPMAASSFRAALSLREAYGDTADPVTAKLLEGLSRAQLRLGQISEARTTKLAALAALRGSVGTETIAVAAAVHNLGVLEVSQGDVAAARRYFEEALALKIELTGDSATTAATLSAMCSTMIDQERYEEALPLCQRARAIELKVLEPTNPAAVPTLNGLAIIADAEGRALEAEHRFLEAAELIGASQGANHPEIAIPMLNVGGVRMDRGDYPGARAAFQRALDIRLHTFGERHLDVAVVYQQLGLLARAEGNRRDAIAELRRALAIVREVEAPRELVTELERELEDARAGRPTTTR